MAKFFDNVYKNKKVLITGHTGFKGSWLSAWLVELGAKVIGYALAPPTEPNIFEIAGLENKIIHIQGDVRDEKLLFSTTKKYRPEFVFHLAAQPLVRFSYMEPRLTYETNIMGTVNLLEAVRKTNSVKVCVIVTSDKCYENKELNYGYKENDPMGGYDPYSSSKGCAELITSAYRRSFFYRKDYGKTHNGLLASVRAGNVIGGGDWGEARLVPDCVRSLLASRAVVIRNPESIRPWQYVLEPLSGYLRLGSLMYNGDQSFAAGWNFGPEEQEVVDVQKLIELLIQNWGTGKYKIDNLKQPHEAQNLKLDISNAKSLLGWRPVYNIRQAVKKTIEGYKIFYGDDNAAAYNFIKSELRDYEDALEKKEV